MKKFLSSVAITLATAGVCAQMPPGQSAMVKEFRLPGIACFLKQVPMELERYEIVTQRREHITQVVVEQCLEGLKKNAFEATFISLREPGVSIQVAHTENMFCMKEKPFFSPTRYSIVFYHFSLTGKQREINRCLEIMEASPEIFPTRPAEQLPPPRPSSLQRNT